MRRLARLLAVTLALALWMAAISAIPMHSATAEEVASGASLPASGEPEEKPTPSPHADDVPQANASDAPPEDGPQKTEGPDGGSAPAETPAANPIETPGETDVEPTLSPPAAPTESPAPPEVPSETPGDVPTRPPEEIPSGTPAISPMPADLPSETPEEPGEPSSIYLVSPCEAVYALGSQVPLTFSIEPPGAPFSRVEGMECAHADGVVTLGAEALEALGAGEHVLAFLFEDGARVDVPLKVTAAKVAAKGTIGLLFIGGKEYEDGQLMENRTNAEQHWAWDAATATVTLDGYVAGKIRLIGGTRVLTVATAAGSVNTIASSVDGSLYSDVGLKLAGSGTLNVTNDSGSAVLSEGTILIEGGTVRADGTAFAFCSRKNDIRVSSGKVEVKQDRGGGFSARNSIWVDGGTVSVEGVDAAFQTLAVSGGTVIIRDCEVGVSGGLNASGGDITIEGMARSGAESRTAMRFANCTLKVSGCGEYGLHTSGDLTVAKGANLSIGAEKIALYAEGKGATVRIDKGANLDLSGGECALKGGKVLVDGKAYAGSYNHVVIRNGAVTRKENAMQRLAAGGRTYGASSLSGDLSGNGWVWTAPNKTLTLNGYDGEAVSAIGCPITLSLQGENRIEGDLTASGAVVTGAGALAASRVVANGSLDVRSGAVGAAGILLGGTLAVSGGAVHLTGGEGPAAECRDFSMAGGELTLSSPDGSQPNGIRASGTAVIRGGDVTVKNFGDFLEAKGDVAITGGMISIGDNTGAGIASGKAIKVTSGAVTIQTARCAMAAKSILISGKPSLHLESATLTAFGAKSVKIAGKAYAPRYAGVKIERGKLVEDYKLQPDLVLEGREYSMKTLNAGDLSGEGWSWSAKRNTLALSGYQGAGIWINRKITVALSSGTVNRGSGDYGGGEAAIYSKEDLTITGSGQWSGGLYGEGKLRIVGSPQIDGRAIIAPQGVAVLGGRVQVSGDIAAEVGDVLIENSRVTAGRVRGTRVDLRKSSLIAADLTGERGLGILGSIVFCAQYGAPGGKVTSSGSPVFRRGSSEVWVLAQSASITRDMSIPPGKNCAVPAGRTLAIAKGKRLYVYGSLAVDGALKGAVVRRSGAGSVEIRSSANVAKGRSIQLSAVVAPVAPDGKADQAVSWSSDSPKILSVSGKGVVTATALSKPGDSSVVTCRTLDGTGVEGTIRLTVTEPVKKIAILHGGALVTRLSVTRSAGSIELAARVEPDAASGRVHWTSSNPAVASVDPDEGTVRPLKKGTVTITCAATDGTKVKALAKLTIK